jgi:hypothetical protein
MYQEIDNQIQNNDWGRRVPNKEMFYSNLEEDEKLLKKRKLHGFPDMKIHEEYEDIEK